MDVVTGAMGSLLPKLSELLMGEYKLQKGVKKDVESLEREMRSMHAALSKVAEVPTDHLDRQVKIWADEVREISYDMEDAVDNFLVRIEGSNSAANSQKLEGIIEKMANLFTKGKARHEIANAIKDIKDRAQEVANRRDMYKVSDIVADPAAGNKVDPRLLALYKNQKELVGIDSARDELTKRLTKDDGDVSELQLKIVAIFGFGGLGKTTLAKAVHDRLQVQFDCRAFVSVGRSPEVKKVLKDILLELDKKERMGDMATLDERQLINKLRQLLENARYLIIIDDIWDLKSWEIIKCALLDNNRGSRIITTTRILEVATKTGDVYKLKPLSQHLSEELFYTRLFGGKDKCHSAQSAEVSNKILHKCGGVPLAIITMASLLAGKTMEDWSKVYSSIGFGYEDGNKDVENTRKIISYSYYDLPPYLRSCLLHLSIYPEDYLIRKDALIWKWVAEGFVVEELGSGLFEIGERYFNELINRSMIQPVGVRNDYTIWACRVHDMVLDMICLLSKKQNFVTILDNYEKRTALQSNDRRLAVQKRAVDHHDPLAVTGMPKLRSYYATMCNISMMPSVTSFQVLRVLSIEMCTFMQGRPYYLEHIGKLLQLRYLGLDDTPIQELPEEIGDLRFLQILYLSNTKIEKFPRSMGLLRKLKRLYTDGDYPIKAANWIGKLTTLEELVLWNTGESLVLVKELGKLTELRVLRIATDEFDDSCQKSFMESLCNLRKIQVLENSDRWSSADETWKGYEPPRQLRDLAIRWAEFSRLPAWINSSLLPSLSILEGKVECLEKQDWLTLGRLPELHSLSLSLNNHIPAGMEFHDGTFPNLRKCEIHAPFNFLQGSMQSLESIEIEVTVQCLKNAGTDFNFISSLGNLQSLQTVTAYIHCEDAHAMNVEEVEAAVRQAIDTHHNHPTLVLLRLGEDKMIKEPAPPLHHTTSVCTPDEQEEESDYAKTEQESHNNDDNCVRELIEGPVSEQRNENQYQTHVQDEAEVAGASDCGPADQQPARARRTWRQWACFSCLNSRTRASAPSATPTTVVLHEIAQAEDENETSQP